MCTRKLTSNRIATKRQRELARIDAPQLAPRQINYAESEYTKASAIALSYPPVEARIPQARPTENAKRRGARIPPRGAWLGDCRGSILRNEKVEKVIYGDLWWSIVIESDRWKSDVGKLDRMTLGYLNMEFREFGNYWIWWLSKIRGIIGRIVKNSRKI